MAWKHEGSSEQRGYGAAWRKLREYVLRRDFYLCQVCARNGRVTAARDVDHIMAKGKGGTDDESNLQSICTPCHKRKTTEEKGHRYRPTIGLDGYPRED